VAGEPAAGTRPADAAAAEAVLCPECGTVVGADWDWCQNCGFDPDHLSPAHSSAARSNGHPAPVVAPAVGQPSAVKAAVRQAARSAPASPVAPAAPTRAASTPPLPVIGVPPSGLLPVDTASKHRRPDRQVVLVVVAVVAVVAVAAAVIVARQGPSSASREQALSKLLIQQSDLPSGWVPVPPTSAVSAPQIACLMSSATSASSPQVVVATAYRSPTGLPNVFEQIEKFTPAGAAKRLSELQGIALHGCPGPTQATNQSGLVFSPARVLTSPVWGDASAMYSIDVGYSTNVVVFVGRVDGYVVLTQFESKVPVDARVASALVSTAMARVRTLG
jgi:hypothetical protein